MNDDDLAQIKNEQLADLYAKLRTAHCPIKPRFGERRLYQLGLVIARFQRLENTVLSLLHTLLGVRCDARLQIVTSELSFRKLLATVSAIATEVEAQDLPEIRFVLKQAAQADEVRSQLIHSGWTNAQKRKAAAKKKKGPKAALETCTETDLAAIATWVDKIDTSADALLFRYLEQTVPQP